MFFVSWTTIKLNIKLILLPVDYLLTTLCSSNLNLHKAKPKASALISHSKHNPKYLNNVSKTSTEVEDAKSLRKVMIQESRSLCKYNLLSELCRQQVGTSQVQAQVSKLFPNPESQDVKKKNRIINEIMSSKRNDAMNECMKKRADGCYVHYSSKVAKF